MRVNDVLSKKRYIGEKGAGNSNRLFKSEWYSFRRLYAGRRKGRGVMAETKERSGIFKFFYIVLTIITFPIFMLLFILRHPFWILFLLCAVAGGAAYYPISQGVKPEDILTWYEAKYKAAKFEFVTKAVESGKTDYIPQAVIDEITAAKKKMEEEKAEAARPKSENYNEKIDRDVKIEQAKEDLKKRKKGFKRKGDSAGKTVGAAAESGKVTLEATESESRLGAKNVPVQEPSEVEQRTGGAALQNQAETLEKSGVSAGGLASFLSKQQENNAEGTADEVLSSGSGIVENGMAGNDAEKNGAVNNGSEKNGAAESGAVKNDTVENGVEKNGAEENDAANNGAANNNAEKSDAAEDGDSDDGDFDIFTDEDFKALQL
uniref:hypothetical protein n=1 Tax=Candidatus Scatocola faecigallinarum TaxID=2840916 RepID=UPI004029F123